VGIVEHSVRFDREAPSLATIVERIGRLTGLGVSVTESQADGVFAVRAKIAFNRYPTEHVEVYQRRQAAPGEPLHQPRPGLPGEPIVRIRIYIAQEPTLFYATLSALEVLGGVPDKSAATADRAGYDLPVSDAELDRRRRKARQRAFVAAGVAVPALVLTSPIWIAKLLISIPGGVRKAYRLMKGSDGTG